MKIRLPKDTGGIVVPGIEISGPRGILQVSMILDTGAAYTMISKAVCEKLGYDLRGAHHQRVQIITANGPIHVPIISVRRIAFGNARAEAVACIVHDIPDIVDVSGLLGLSFLKHFRTVINYPKFTLHIA